MPPGGARSIILQTLTSLCFIPLKDHYPFVDLSLYDKDSETKFFILPQVTHLLITSIRHPEPVYNEARQRRLDSGSIRNRLVKIPKQVRNDTNCKTRIFIHLHLD